MRTAPGLAPKAPTPPHNPIFEALGTTLDSIDVGVIIVGREARILHANQAAKRMLDQRSPIVSQGGCLGALRADLTKEFKNGDRNSADRRVSYRHRRDRRPAHRQGNDRGHRACLAARSWHLACDPSGGSAGRRSVCCASDSIAIHRYRHHRSNLRTDAGRGPAPATAHRRCEPHRSGQRTRHCRGHCADAPQPHLRQDRRVAPDRSAHADY